MPSTDNQRRYYFQIFFLCTTLRFSWLKVSRGTCSDFKFYISIIYIVVLFVKLLFLKFLICS